MKPIISILFLFVLATLTFAHEGRSNEAMFGEYLSAGSALANDSLTGATQAAKRLQHLASEAKKEMKDNQKELEVVSSEAEKLSTSKDLESARNAYERMSQAMISLKSDLNIKANEYYCPMLKKSWLQKDPKIQNPYIGKSMAGCGEKKSK